MSGIDWHAVAERHDGVETCPLCGSLVFSEDGTCPACNGEMYPEEKTYSIVRFRFKGNSSEVIETGLALEEAQDHCNREYTHGEGWFDGYREE